MSNEEINREQILLMLNGRIEKVEKHIKKCDAKINKEIETKKRYQEELAALRETRVAMGITQICRM